MYSYCTKSEATRTISWNMLKTVGQNVLRTTKEVQSVKGFAVGSGSQKTQNCGVYKVANDATQNDGNWLLLWETKDVKLQCFLHVKKTEEQG